MWRAWLAYSRSRQDVVEAGVLRVDARQRDLLGGVARLRRDQAEQARQLDAMRGQLRQLLRRAAAQAAAPRSEWTGNAAGPPQTTGARAGAL